MPRSEMPLTPLKAELARRGGIQHKWLASQLGVSQWTFWRIEAGVQAAPDGYYERAAEILGVPVETIRREPEGVAA